MNTSQECKLIMQTLKDCQDSLRLFEDVNGELTELYTGLRDDKPERSVPQSGITFQFFRRLVGENPKQIELNFAPKFKEAIKKLQLTLKRLNDLASSQRCEIPIAMDSKIHELEEELNRSVQSKKEAENKIRELSREVQEAENKIRELSRKIERADPSFIDMKFTGNVQKRDKIENSVKTFFKYNYTQAMKKLNDSPNWNEEEVDDLLVGVSKFAYDSAKEVLLQGVCDELEDIFNHQASTLDDERELIRLRDLSQAFGLLLCHFKKDDLHSKTEEILQKKVKGNSHLSRLYEKVNDEGILKTFKEQFIENAVQMITMSPPMFMVMPETFDDSINGIPYTTSDPPLHYRRLVIMKNYFGDVSMEGIAGNKESFLKIFTV